MFSASRLALFIALSLCIAEASLPLCVWYRSAPICGSGNDCPSSNPYLLYQASSSSDAQYCPNSFGSQCWTGKKNLCCSTNVNLYNTGSYNCGSDFKKE